jgi:hypothetical protein
VGFLRLDDAGWRQGAAGVVEMDLRAATGSIPAGTDDIEHRRIPSLLAFNR